MADSNDTNNMPQGTTIVFGSWAYTANGSGGYTSHLITPEELETPDDKQLADSSVELSEKPPTQVPSALNSERVRNVPAPTHHGGSVEPDIVPDSENFPKPSENT